LTLDLIRLDAIQQDKENLFYEGGAQLRLLTGIMEIKVCVIFTQVFGQMPSAVALDLENKLVE
jgi:hypothetical protein